MRYELFFRGRSNRELGLEIVTRPNIRAAEEDVKVTELAGRQVSLTERTGQYKNVEIPVTFNYASAPEHWAETFRNAVLWLRGAGRLEFSDDPEAFYKALYVMIGENARRYRRLGKFTATFVCAPGEYLKTGRRWAGLREETVYNSWSMAEPDYELRGEGSCELTVNGKVMRAAVSGLLRIDTEGQRTTLTDGTEANTAVSGDYEDLVLLPGENTVKVSEGFGLRLRPNWRVV